MMTAVWIALIAFAAIVGFFSGAACRIAKREDEEIEELARRMPGYTGDRGDSELVLTSPHETCVVKTVCPPEWLNVPR